MNGWSASDLPFNQTKTSVPMRQGEKIQRHGGAASSVGVVLDADTTGPMRTMTPLSVLLHPKTWQRRPR